MHLKPGGGNECFATRRLFSICRLSENESFARPDDENSAAVLYVHYLHVQLFLNS